MNEFLNAAKVTKANIQEKMTAAMVLNDELESHKEYNASKKEELDQVSIAAYNEKLMNLTTSFLTVIEDVKNSVSVSLDRKFTLNLSDNDAIILSSLSQIELSKEELKLQFKKYSDNPLVLRRLEGIAKEKGFDIAELAQEFISNHYNYDFYVEQLDMFIEGMKSNFEEAMAINPKMTTDQGSQVVVELLMNLIDSKAAEATELFEAVF